MLACDDLVIRIASLHNSWTELDQICYKQLFVQLEWHSVSDEDSILIDMEDQFRE
jgi:hypothetical protein